MTEAQALAVIWVLTMVALGFVISRMNHWKARHDFDHGLAARLYMLLQTMQPTPKTWETLDKINKDAGENGIMLALVPGDDEKGMR